MHLPLRFGTKWLAVGLLLSACATAPKGPETSAKRNKDSAPERIAAQQAGAPHSLQLESENARWGFDAARERREEEAKKKAQNTPPNGSKSTDVTSPR